MVFFSRGKGGGEEIEYGFKGKGTTTHLLVDGNGSPILDRVNKHMVALSIKGIIPILEADKGYDAELLRDKLLKRKIFPWICRHKKRGKETEKVESVLKRMRWKVERAISWLQRKFRRLAIRWERKVCYWKGFLALSLIIFWVNKLVG